MASDGNPALWHDAREAKHHGWVVPEGFFDLQIHTLSGDFHHHAAKACLHRLVGMAAVGLRQS